MPDHFSILKDDVVQNLDVLNKNDTQLSRRNYLRSLCAYYEYVLSILQEVVTSILTDEYDLHSKNKEGIEFFRIIPLLDFTVRLDESGNYRLEPNKTPLCSMVAYTLKTYAELVEINNPLSDKRWNDFRLTIKIRNRITHPKNANEICISDSELQLISAGWNWWTEAIQVLHDKYLADCSGMFR